MDVAEAVNLGLRSAHGVKVVEAPDAACWGGLRYVEHPCRRAMGDGNVCNFRNVEQMAVIWPKTEASVRLAGGKWANIDGQKSSVLKFERVRTLIKQMNSLVFAPR